MPGLLAEDRKVGRHLRQLLSDNETDMKQRRFVADRLLIQRDTCLRMMITREKRDQS